MRKKLVITGGGIVSPLGYNREEFCGKLFSNQSGITPVESFDTTGYDCHVAGELKDFDPKEFLGRKGLRNMDRSTQLILTASLFAVEDSGYPLSGDLDEDIGVVAGNTLGDIKSMSEYDRISILDSPKYVSPTDFANCVINSAAGNVSIRFNAMCVNVTMSNGISSTLDSFAYAMDFILLGRARMLIVGGVEAFSKEAFYGFHSVGLLDTGRKLRGPFDRQSGGIILGEGSGMFIAESYEDAAARGARIDAVMLGYGRYFNDGKDQLRAMTRCMEKALEDAGISPSDVDAVVASGNGYGALDELEILALEKLFSSVKEPLPVTSVKGHTGECYSASGAFQIAGAVGMFEENAVFPVAGLEECREHASFLLFPGERIEKDINIVLINSFGFSGSNTSVVLRKAEK